VAVQEQVWAVVRNLTADEIGTELVMANMVAFVLQSSLVVALASRNEDVVLQVTDFLSFKGLSYSIVIITSGRMCARKPVQLR
jgi:hypothetical protein